MLNSGELFFIGVAWGIKALSSVLPDGYGLEISNQGVSFIDYDQLNNEEHEPVEGSVDQLAERLKKFVREGM